MYNDITLSPRPDLGTGEHMETVMPQHMVVAMAYVPDQVWDEIYENDVALSRGTIFPELDKPFIGEEMPRR